MLSNMGISRKIFQVCSVLASAALGGCRSLLSVMEQRTVPAPEPHLKHVSAPSSLAHWYVNMHFQTCTAGMAFPEQQRLFSFNRRNRNCNIARNRMWPRRKEEEEEKKEKGKYFLLRNPKPHCDMVISRKQLSKWGTGLCQSKQTADTARESSESRVYCSNNVAADNGCSAVRWAGAKLFPSRRFLQEKEPGRIRWCPPLICGLGWFFSDAKTTARSF